MHRTLRISVQKALAAVGVIALVTGVTSIARAAGPLLASPAAVIEGAQSDAAFGYSVASAGDVNGDGYDDVIVGAPQYSSTQLHQGAAFVFHGGPDGIAGGDWSSAATLLEGPDSYGEFYFGYGVAGVGDVNGDGYDDVIVDNPGNTLLYLGGPNGIPSGDWSIAATVLNNSHRRATGVGDVNGDGYDDIATASGRDVFVVRGGPEGIASGPYPSVASTSLADAQASLTTAVTVSGAGDPNGDGYDDVIVGEYDYDSGLGAAFVLLGGPAGIPSGDLASAATVLRSDQASAWFGVSVDGAGDTNGDGYDDVVVGAYVYDGYGAAFVFHGGPNGVPSALAKDAPTILKSHWNEEFFGTYVVGAGDVNGDGFDDVIVGFDSTPSAVGPALVYLGAWTGTSPVAAGTLVAAEEGAPSGYSANVDGAGDVNGDGYDDVVVGAYSCPNETYTGRAVVYQGGGDEWKLLAYDYNSLWARTAKIGEAYDYGVLRDYPSGFGPFTHVASGPRYTFFYNSSTGAAALATVSTSGVVTTLRAWAPGSFGPGWTHVVWHGDNLFFYCQGNGLGAVGRFEGPTFTFHQYNSFTLAAGWTHVASVQSYLLLYKASTGGAYACQLVPAYSGPSTIAAINLRYVRAQTFSTGWTHIVDSQHGVLFYNGSNGGYRVGDFDGTGYLTTRTAPWPAWSAYPLWKYTTQRAGWTSVTASGDRLLFYDKNTGEGVTGYVRTTAESNAEQAEPLARMQTYPFGSLSYPGEQKWSHIVPVAPW